VKDRIEKAQVLLDALPYIREHAGKTFVIKYGGSAQINEILKDKFAQDIALFHLVGIKVIIVHGGGKKITSLLDKLQIESEFVNGLRVTDKESMEIVEMVLSGNINKEITTMLNHHGAKAIGITGKDADFFFAKPLEGGKYGLVGVTESALEKAHSVSPPRKRPAVTPSWVIGDDTERLQAGRVS